MPKSQNYSDKSGCCYTILQTIIHLPRKFPDCSKTFKMVWKVSGQSRNFLHCPETFHIIKKMFYIIWKLSSEKFPECPETFHTVFCGTFCKYAQKLSGRAKNFWSAMSICRQGFWDSASYIDHQFFLVDSVY